MRATIWGVLTALLYLVVMVAVAAVVFLFASLVFGRGEEMAPLAPGATPTWLPEHGVSGEDVRTLRFQQAVRGYKMSEVDWALRRLASELDALRARVAELEGGEAPTGGEAARAPVEGAASGDEGVRVLVEGAARAPSEGARVPAEGARVPGEGAWEDALVPAGSEAVEQGPWHAAHDRDVAR